MAETDFVQGQSFYQGRDTDTSYHLTPNTKYTSAYNLELTGDGKFLSLQNIKGTSLVHDFTIGNEQEILAVYQTKWLISGVSKECLTYFIYVGSTRNFVIGVLDLATNDFYQPFSEIQPADYYSDDRVIDARLYPENGAYIIYFSDFYNEPRFIKCENPATTLSAYDVSLLRRGSNGTITLSSVGTTGSLLSGTYQFSYRMVDPINKRFTRWSTLTSPIAVYDKANSTTPVYSGIGLLTNRKITLSITPSTAETTEFDFLQLAVVENVGVTQTQTASLLEITAIPGTSLTYEYKSNSKIGSIPTTDITVDLAPIKKVKTLAIKENRLIAGNVHYTALAFDNGNPQISGGSILKQDGSTVDNFASDDFASRYVGHFRGEVYRYGLVFADEFGNKSSVIPLDLSSVTGNAIRAGLKDLKFPDRGQSGTNGAYSLFSTNGRIQSLGLRLLGLTNIPSWARSVEIVRVPRKKDILFQTPVIPMTYIEGVGAIDNYPTTYNNGSENTADSAQPQTASKIYVPKNLFIPELRRIERTVTSTTNTKAGEARYNYQGNDAFTFSMIFPSGSMYTGDGTTAADPFISTGAEKVDFVDFALLKASIENQNTTSKYTIPSDFVSGDDLQTNLSGNFYASSEGQYYFDSTWVGKQIPTLYRNLPIVDYEFFNNFGQPASVAGSSVMDYEALQTLGVDWGYKPNVLKCAVVKLTSPSQLVDINSNGINFVFKNATYNARSAGGSVTSQNQIKYESTSTNRWVDNYAGFTANSTYVTAIGIANVKLGLGDDRYGDLNSFHEYQSTGAKYTFSASEIATLEDGGSITISQIDVWGGDCFIGPQIFKISDSTYSIVNVGKNETDGDSLKKWGKFYTNSLGSKMSIAVPVENASQYVQVFLESEFSEVRDVDTISYTSGTVPIYNVVSKDSMRVPLTYRYNTNLLQQNIQKIFIPKQTYSFEQNEFAARLVYSDLKIYNSDQAGFDIFRVGNAYDLEESRGDITKLALAGDNLYAIQEQGVTYIPTGERQLEETNAGQIGIRSGDIIGRPLVIDTSRGSQHLKGICETGDIIFVPDNINKSIYVLAGQELKPITENNETQFRDFFEDSIAEKNIINIYDPVRKEYWLVDKSNNKCEVFNEKIGWVGNYEFTGLKGGAWANQKLYVIGRPSTSMGLYTMYTGTVGNLFGNVVVPRVTFVSNYKDFSKVFTNVMIAATEMLGTIDYETQRTGSTQVITGTVIEDWGRVRGGKIVMPIPLTEDEGRLRGPRMLTTIKWKAGVQSALQNVYIKGRFSARMPF